MRSPAAFETTRLNLISRPDDQKLELVLKMKRSLDEVSLSTVILVFNLHAS